jgi:protein TonB
VLFRDFFYENGLLLTLLAGSAVGHWSLTLGDAKTRIEVPIDRNYGRNSIAVHLVASRPKSEASVEEVRLREKDPVDTKPLETARVDPTETMIRRREVTDPILMRQTSDPAAETPQAVAGAAPPTPQRKETPEKETPEEPIRRPKPARQKVEVQRPIESEVDVTLLSVESTGVDVKPRALARVDPAYPADLLLRRIPGNVQLLVTIDVNGRATNVRIHQSSGYDSMDQSASEAVKRWPFSPALRGGQAVPHDVIVPIEFKIGERRG